MMQKENVYIGSESGDSSTDFKDVFGGPPRRFSMQEVTERYSFGLSSSEEKPVFGEERRRRKGADFFDDIFKGSPRRSDRDSGVFGSSPGSRIMSPATARPFSPKPHSPPSSSLPAAHFSLPAKSTKGVDLPTFGSNSHGGSYESSIPNSWGPFSRFSNEASRSLDDMIRNEAQPVRPLSDEAEDSPFNPISDEDETIEKDVRNVGSISDQFHFSIYKWAGKGVPMLMPFVIGNNLKSKDSMKYEKSNGRTESKSSSVRSRADKKQDHNHVDEAFYDSSEPKSTSSPNDTVAFDRSVKSEKVESVVVSNAGEKIVKEVHVKIIEETKDKKARAPGVDGDSKKVKDKADGKSAAAKGKVKDFVHIFNQETDSRSKVADFLWSRRRENVDIGEKGNEVSSNQGIAKEQVGLHNYTDKKPDVSFKVVKDLKNEAQRISPKRISTSSRSSSRLRKSFSAGTLLEDLKMPQENLEDPFGETFEVHELSDGNDNVTENENSSEETRAIDAKIRQWSVGKKGNIRSLLSTLQYVLWDESGWKAVPLVDLIEANSVKKAYQKALLRLHPDKLQQKGAAFQHKYIAEKVFDILQEAWDHFNTSSLGI